MEDQNFFDYRLGARGGITDSIGEVTDLIEAVKPVVEIVQQFL